MIEYDASGDITRVTHEHDHDPVPAVVTNAIRHLLAGRTLHAREALGELDIPQLRRASQAMVQLTSVAAQIIVGLAIDDKRAKRAGQ
jgi:hypothetical protein